MYAKVKLVSTASNEKGNYKVVLDIYNWGILKNKMIAGLEGEASILYEEKTLFGYVFSQLKKKTINGFN